PWVGTQAYINYFVSNAPARPGGIFTFGNGLAAAIERWFEGIPLLGAANSPWTFWFPEFAQQLLFPTGKVPWQLAITVAIYVFLALTVKTYRINMGDAIQDSRVAAIGLFVAFPLLLLSCMMLGSYNYVGNTRYYWPLTPLSVFVVYSFLSAGHTHKSAGIKIIHSLAVIYLSGYIAMTLSRAALFFAPGEYGAMRRGQMMGSGPAPWPSQGMDHEYSPARRFVAALVKDESNTVLLVTNK